MLFQPEARCAVLLITGLQRRGAELFHSADVLSLPDWFLLVAQCSKILVIGGQREFREVILLFYDKDLGRARGDRLLDLLQQVQGWMLLEQFHNAIALTLAKDLATGQDARSTGNASIGQGDYFHFLPFPFSGKIFSADNGLASLCAIKYTVLN